MPDKFVHAQMVSKKRRILNDRETLAEFSFRKKCAKHKGRNHWRNWERRQMAKLKKENSQKEADKRNTIFQAYHVQVAAYWTGHRSEHPVKP